MNQARSKAQVLVIDDDAMVRLMARETLEQAGFEVAEAANAEDGLARFERTGCDLVLIDLLLPGMDGFEACRRLRTHPAGADLPIILITGRDDREAIRRAYDDGATDFVTKPIVWDLLPYRVRFALRAQAALRDSVRDQTLLANAQRMAHLGSWEWQRNTDELHCSEELHRIHGTASDGGKRQLHAMLLNVHGEDRDALSDALQRCLIDGQPYGLEFRIVRPDGIVRRLFEQTDVEFDAKGKVVALRGIRHDITQRVEADQRIRRLANFDSLTGLANRGMFREMAQHWLPYAARRGLISAVLVVDIDRFKLINETLGPVFADEVLKAVAERLRECVRASDIKAFGDDQRGDEPLARLGADEFTLMLIDVGDPDQALRVARRITHSLALPMQVQDQVMSLSCSVGVAMAPQDGQDPDALLSHATMAMRAAKAGGREQVRFYDGAMSADVQRRLTIENDLKRALGGDELKVYYQAKVDMRQRRVIGAEALLRWQHPTRGLVSPIEFIPIAEESGLIVPMTHWIIRDVCKKLALWREAGLNVVPVSVNLAAASLAGDDLAQTISSALARYGVPAALLEFEVTESSLMGDMAQASRVLQQLKGLGLKLSIDDFGTGYSSLTYLKRFPVDVLKIDRSFIMDLSTDANDAALTAAIIAMGNSLNLELVAEGVETQAQAEFLMARGCDLAQGFLYARPLAEDAFAEVLANGLPGAVAPLPYQALS